MAVVNVNSLLSGKDSRWLQLEVCREFQRQKCTRPDTECKFAHPPANVEVQNGRVTACYDSIKGRCNREKPPCKYFHPPQHLKDQLLINGRNHLALKNALLQQMGFPQGQTMVNQVPAAVDMAGKLQFPASNAATAAAATAIALGQPHLGLMASPYLQGMPQVGNAFNPYFNAAQMLPATAALIGPDPNNPLSMAVQQTVVTQQKLPRADRLEVCREFSRGLCKRNDCCFAHPGDNVSQSADGKVVLCLDFCKGRCSRPDCRYFHPNSSYMKAAAAAAQTTAAWGNFHLASTAAANGLAAYAAAVDIGRKRPHESNDDLLMMDMKTVGAAAFYYENLAAFPGMVPYKRAAGDKSGVPVYQQNAAAMASYQQLVQPFVPVSYSDFLNYYHLQG